MLPRTALALFVLLAALPSVGGAQEPTPHAVLADLPFLEDPNRTAIFLDLAPEGSARGLRLQLDTGAQSSVITPGLARDLGISVRRLKVTPYRRATRLGRDLQFHVQARSGDQAARTSPFEYGLLGGNFLEQYVLEIDYPARRVRFLDPDRYSVPERASEAGAEVLPLRIVGRRPLVEIRVGEHELYTLLDTGAPVGVIVGGRSVGALALEPRRLLGLRLFGVMGEVKTGVTEAPRVGLGGFAFDHWPLVVAPRGLYQQATSTDSAIGHDLLANFRLRIDYKRRRLWLARVGDGAPRLLGHAWMPARDCGALLEPEGERFWVRFVVEGSPAQKLGLAPNDLIEGVGPAGPDAVNLRATPASVAAAIAAGSHLRVLRADAEGEWQAFAVGAPLP